MCALPLRLIPDIQPAPVSVGATGQSAALTSLPLHAAPPDHPSAARAAGALWGALEVDALLLPVREEAGGRVGEAADPDAAHLLGDHEVAGRGVPDLLQVLGEALPLL